MISFSHHKLFLLLTAIVLISLGVSSCAKTEPWTWERDYYTYQKGARINGVEYHEKYDWNVAQLIFGGAQYCGFIRQEQNGFVRAQDSESSNYEFWWAGPNIDVYGIRIWVYADSATFKPGSSFYFHEPEEGYDYKGWEDAFDGAAVFKYLPIAVGYIARGYNDFYAITNGQITFGSFNLGGLNDEQVCFCFTAENPKGNIITVEDGYINKYTTEYFVEYPTE